MIPSQSCMEPPVSCDENNNMVITDIRHVCAVTLAQHLTTLFHLYMPCTPWGPLNHKHCDASFIPHHATGAIPCDRIGRCKGGAVLSKAGGVYMYIPWGLCYSPGDNF